MKIRIKRVPGNANNITRGVINFLIAHGHFAFRVNSTGIFDPNQSIFRKSGSTGLSDVIACIDGAFIAIEVKVGTDRMRPSQKIFSENVLNAHGRYVVVKTYQDFLSWYNKEYYQITNEVL